MRDRLGEGLGREGQVRSRVQLSSPAAVVRLVQNHVAKYPFHDKPPTYLRAQRYKYWFSKPGERR